MTRRSMRGQVAVAGVGETDYYRHGNSPDPEFVLCLKAILAACADAGIDPKDIDGFASYSNDRNDPPSLATALGTHELRFSNMQWGGGGGGGAGADGQRVGGRRHRPGRLRRGLSCAGAGPVRPLRPGRAGVDHHRRHGLERPLRPDVAGPVVCAQGHPLHARAQHRPGGAACDRHGLLSPRPGQSARGDVRPAADRAGL